jgi:pyruvate formate lyase activating enzyme
MQGIVFDIKRFAVHDGPGIRTTVFLKGCPLKCQWCHNPESIDSRPLQSIKKIKLDDIVFDRMEDVGITISVDQVIDLLKKDFVFMEESDGGVTFSGGEPTMQPEFLYQMLKACKKENLHTAVDTCGYASEKTFASILLYTDLFLFDLKHHNSSDHEVYTGKPNDTILKNLEFLLRQNKRVRVRIPVIPGVNDAEKDLLAMSTLLKSFNRAVERIDLLPYHTIAKHKYKRFGINNTLEDVKALTKEDLKNVKELFEASGFTVKIGG